MRNLLQVQLTVLHVPWFVPGDKLLSSAHELGLLPLDLQQAIESTADGASGIAATVSAETMASILQQASFPGSRALAFTDFLALLAVCKRHYAAWSSQQMAPEAIHEAIRYVVEAQGDWKEDDTVIGEDDGGLASSSPIVTSRSGAGASWSSATSLMHASRTSTEDKTDNLKTYLGWFGVRGEVLRDVNTDVLLRQVQHAADAEGAAEAPAGDAFDLMAISSAAHKPPSIAQVGTIALGLKRHRASIQKQKELLAASQQRQRGSSILADMLMSKLTPKGSLASPSSAVVNNSANSMPAPHSKVAWLEPQFPPKGVGPRGSMFAMDTPPTPTEWDEHRHRMVSATMRGGARRMLQHGARLNGESILNGAHRTVADLLRLPHLPAEELKRLEQHAADAQELSMRRGRSAEPPDTSFWRTGGPEKRLLLMARRPPTSLEINYIIDETYRKAKDLGVQTSKADATVERRLADQRRLVSQRTLEARKSELRSGFSLREDMAQKQRKWAQR